MFLALQLPFLPARFWVEFLALGDYRLPMNQTSVDKVFDEFCGFQSVPSHRAVYGMNRACPHIFDYPTANENLDHFMFRSLSCHCFSTSIVQPCSRLCLSKPSGGNTIVMMTIVFSEKSMFSVAFSPIPARVSDLLFPVLCEPSEFLLTVAAR